MKDLFIDCPNGLSGDMLLGALFDLGVPSDVVNQPLEAIGFKNKFSLTISESKSFGLRGNRVFVESLEPSPIHRRWIDIKKLILGSPLRKSLQKKILYVFNILASAEASVHGIDVDKVEFHEIGSIDSLVDVVGVCASIEYLNPSFIFCATPPSGSGFVETSHGFLPVPVPAVLELAKNHQVKLSCEHHDSTGELTTPTGLALMIGLVNSFVKPDVLAIDSIGIGLGSRDLDRPNLLRVCLLKESKSESYKNTSKDFAFEKVFIQEAWIDDSSPEDLPLLVNRLKDAGAIEVVSQSIQMKKNRSGVSVRAIVREKDLDNLRPIWFVYGSTIGFRETMSSRWTLPRRKGTCQTTFGEIKVKQVRRPDGRLTIKIEHDELMRISLLKGVPLDEIRNQVMLDFGNFSPTEDWNS